MPTDRDPGSARRAGAADRAAPVAAAVTFPSIVASLRLDGRVAIVTGASSGLGARFAAVLAAAGATVVAAARRADRLDALVGELPGAVAMACDLAAEEQRQRLVASVLDRFGAVDVLVNNAGAGGPVPAEEESLEGLHTTLEINLVAAYRLAQLAGVDMLRRGSGSIVNVSSVLGLVGVGQIPQAAYVASKHGLVGLTRELAAQWGRRGVRVNAIAPGWFRTEMTAEMFDDESSVRWLRRKTPLGRGGNPSELDAALLFLASEASSYVTGQVLAVDGGYTAV